MCARACRGVIYERGRPTNNAPTLSYAQGQMSEVKVFLGIIAVVAAFLVLNYWRDYAALIKRRRGDQCGQKQTLHRKKSASEARS